MARRNRDRYQARSVIRFNPPPIPPLVIVRPPRRTLIDFNKLRRLDLTKLEDRRQWHPDGKFRAAATFSRRDQRRLVERFTENTVRDYFPSAKIGFAIPDKVVRCVKRKRRKEVMFALNLTGKGSKVSRRKRDEYSDIKC